MSDWTAGYVADIGYTFGYYAELNPLRVKQIFSYVGLRCPEMGVACELGFGQGMSVNLHAAASITEWYGTDFNPSQAGFAQEMADVSGSNAKLFSDAFSSFANRIDLPDFDYIGVHGIWSWISDENRAAIVDFVSRKLKVGGVLYISYNTLPGWSTFSPMRHLMTKHAEILGVEGYGIVNRINGALEFSEKLLEVGPIFSRANPQVAERFNKIKGQDRNYLAHEYFNRDWHPMYFSSMVDWLSPAKLGYACSEHLTDLIDVINLTSEQLEFLKGIPDAMFRETVRDFMVNQQFRRDYWVKGLRKISLLEKVEVMRTLRVVLTVLRSDIELKVTGSLGEASLSESIYNPILDFLADHKIKTIGQIEQVMVNRGITFSQVVQAVMLLTGSGQMSVAQEENIIIKAKKHTDKLNSYIMSKAGNSGDISYLASPVTGGGIAVKRFDQIFLLGVSKGKIKPNECAQFAWQTLVTQGQHIMKEGRPLETGEENIKELTEQAIIFLEKQLPILKALHVV